MPLIVLCGLPCSGKSTRAKELRESFLKYTNLAVIVVSDETHFDSDGKDDVYGSTSKEKNLRASVKSEVHRALSKDAIVIMDAQNYIKGYRYELWCNTPITEVKQWNEAREPADQYTGATLDALVMRFEPPNSQNRWEHPLLTVLPSDPLPATEILELLTNRRALPPNLSTQSQPLAATNYLHELDKLTQEAVAAIISSQQNGILCHKIIIPGSDETLILTRMLPPAELSRLRRQFISHSRTRPVDDLLRIPTVFVQYLKSSIKLT